jgi:hypothetical protein
MIFKFKNIFLVICFLSASSCSKVIDVNLNNAPSEIVIAGEVTNMPGPYTVSISRSVNYTADNVFPPVSGATVIISSDGINDTLEESAPGNYLTHQIHGIQGSSYSLYVSAEGNTYTATSTMPQAVGLDSIGFTSTTRKSSNLNAVVYFQDPPGLSNYYRFFELNNGKPLSNGRGNFVFDDRLSDGRYIEQTLFNDSSSFKIGDSVTISMRCISKDVYNYWYQFIQVSGNGNGGFSAPTPSNPISNITGGALGYFSANTIQTVSVIIK